MPAILTHYLFAKQNMPEELKDYSAYVLAGTQGPDPFMAYGTNPLKKREDTMKVQPWGNAMHHLHLGSVYLPMIAYARKQPESIKKVLFAYIEGLFMHFSLDRQAHPYVFYRTGFDKNGNYAGEAVFYHGAFEALLDKTIAVKNRLKVTPAKALGHLDPEMELEIGKCWASAAKMPLKDSSFAESYEEYIFVEKILYSRTGFKRALFRKAMGNRSKAYSMMAPAHLKKYEPIDVLNEKHSPWYDPTTFVESHDSIADIFAKAAKAYASVRPLLARAMQGEDVSKEITIWENNIDHDGGLYGQRKTKYVNCYKELNIEP